MTDPALTTAFAEFAAGASLDYVAADVRDNLEVLVADYLGVTLRGSLTDAARLVAAEAVTPAPARAASVIGGRAHAEAGAAAMANAVASHSIELDDVDGLALFHFSPPVVSAALAVAEATGADGAALHAAVTVGCEVMARLSAAMNPSLRDRGFHTTPVCGIFGATAAACRLLGASPAQTASAFGLAGAQAGGLMQMYGPSMQKRFNPAPAARDGVLSAFLAYAGFEGASDILEGQRGVLRTIAGVDPDAACLDGLGETSAIDIEFKAYACARPIHNAIDAALDVRAQLGVRIDEVARIDLARHPDWAHYHVIEAPRTYHEAQVSVNYGVGLALVRGAAFIDDYLDTVGVDARVAELARRVEVRADLTLTRGVSCALTVTTRDGTTARATVDHPRGSSAFPLGRDGARAKFRSLATRPLGEDAVDAAWDTAISSVRWPSVAEAMTAFR